MPIKYIALLSNIIGFAVYMLIKYTMYDGYAITIPYIFAVTIGFIVCIIFLIQLELRSIDEDYLKKITMYKPTTLTDKIKEMESWGDEQESIDETLETYKRNGLLRDGLIYEFMPEKDKFSAEKLIGLIPIAIIIVLPLGVIASIDRLFYIF